jgi:predicted PurR-regulated permease PerM
VPDSGGPGGAQDQGPGGARDEGSSGVLRTEAWLWLVRGAGATVGALAVGLLAWLLLGALQVVLVVIVSILLAAGLEPVVGWLRGRTGLSRSATTLLVYAVFAGLVALLVLLVVPAAASQLNDLSARLPHLLAEVRAWTSTLEPRFIANGLTEAVDAIAAALRDPQAAEADPEDLVTVGLLVADALVTMVTVLTLVFFWLNGHQRIQRFALALLPAHHRAGVRRGWNEVETRLGLWVRGQLVLMGSIFLATTAAYLLLGLPNALLLGLIAGVAELIPILGPLLGAIPALIVAAVTGRPELVVLVAIVYLVIQVVEGNVLVPMVMRRTIGLPPFLVLVSLVVGATVGGLVGALLAIPLVAAAVVVLERTQARDVAISLEGRSASDAPTSDERDELGRVAAGQPIVDEESPRGP